MTIYPSMHVLTVGGLAGANPCSTGRACKVHTKGLSQPRDTTALTTTRARRPRPTALSCFYGVWCCSALNWKLPQPDGKWLLASQHLMPAFLQTREELGLLSSWVLKVVQNWSWNCTSLVKSLVQVWASYTSSFTSSFPTCKRPYKPVTLQSYRLVSNENKILWVSKNMEPG